MNKIDISKLDEGKIYEFKVMYKDYSDALIESDWVKITNNGAWRDSFNEAYYPVAYRDID